MDRLLSLKKLDASSVLNNTSISSECGYETAQDDSLSSFYYSINEDFDDTLSNSPGQQQVTIVPESTESSITGFVETQTSFAEPMESTEQSHQPIISWSSDVVAENVIDAGPVVSSMNRESQTNQNTKSSIPPPVEMESSTQTSFAEPMESMEPIISSTSNVVTDNLIDTGPAVTSMNRESQNHQMDSIGLDAITAAQNLIFNLPSGPALSSSNLTNFAGSSSIVQELYVVEVAQQQTNIPPELSRVTRRTTVRFQDMPRRNEMPRRSEMPRRNDVPRISEMPRRTILSLSRRTEVTTNTETRPLSRRTLMEVNSETRPEANRKESHICDICKMSFPLRSTLTVHRNSHKTNCKYCDRTFKKALALSIHLKENCEKIPLAVRRRILTKEFKNASSKV